MAGALSPPSWLAISAGPIPVHATIAGPEADSTGMNPTGTTSFIASVSAISTHAARTRCPLRCRIAPIRVA
ncbi:MAG TPA: hypothetical protein VF638_15985 [Sphingomonas sp.]